MTKLSDFNLREIELFVIASRSKSLREAARRTRLLPAHVSKIMKKFEQKLGQDLFRRNSAGVVLSTEGLRLLKIAESMLEVASALDPESSLSQKRSSREKIWTLGSISFIASYLLAPRIQEWKSQLPDTRFRLIEFTHNDLVPFGLKGAFEFAVHIGRQEWTHSWDTLLLGKETWGLYARKGHALGGRCRHGDLLKHAFIVPTDWHESGYSAGEDFCPLPFSQRLRGDEASTAETALELVSRSEQLTFVPNILARSWAERGLVSRIAVEEWPKVEKEIFLTLKADLVPKRLVNVILKSFAASNA